MYAKKFTAKHSVSYYDFVLLANLFTDDGNGLLYLYLNVECGLPDETLSQNEELNVRNLLYACFFLFIFYICLSECYENGNRVEHNLSTHKNGRIVYDVRTALGMISGLNW